MTEAKSDSRIEREAKFSTWPGFVLPDLDRVLPSVSAGARAEIPLDATYWDTPDLRLIRWGTTIRYRTEAGRGMWTVKLPGKTEGGVLSRPEHDIPGSPNTIPDAALDLVRGYARTAPLAPVARLQTLRRRAPLFDPRGHRIAEVADDEVSVLDGERVAARFREVELEVTSEAPHHLLPALIERLRAAGAGEPDPTPKLVRALGPRALAPPELVVPTIDAASPVGDVARAAITAAVIRIIEHDALVRRDTKPEGVHQARVGTRRLRSDLRTFVSIFDAEWGDGIRNDLKALADALGHVRDADVMLTRLKRASSELDPQDWPAAESVRSRLARQRAAQRRALDDVYGSREYLQLLDRLVEAAAAPRFVEAAQLPATQALPSIVQRPWNHLVKAVGELGDEADPDHLHEIRIRAKRVRYAAEAAMLAIADAEPMARTAAVIQDLLGEQHDAIVAARWLRDVASTNVTRGEALVCGLLIAA
ncbi:MAG TPA: CYTH and CHAD domain-containing protein, partial [Acidimicrobiales bacterium]|nr:CYTH and CHAD domain-containing protein [Acidimicrobiales bacterium]